MKWNLRTFPDPKHNENLTKATNMKSTEKNVGFPQIRLLSDWPENAGSRWKPRLPPLFNFYNAHLQESKFHLVVKTENDYGNTGYKGV